MKQQNNESCSRFLKHFVSPFHWGLPAACGFFFKCQKMDKNEEKIPNKQLTKQQLVPGVGGSTNNTLFISDTPVLIANVKSLSDYSQLQSAFAKRQSLNIIL